MKNSGDSFDCHEKWKFSKIPVFLFKACETRSYSVSLAPPRAPLTLSLLHSIVFHMPLSVSSTLFKNLKKFYNMYLKMTHL